MSHYKSNARRAAFQDELWAARQFLSAGDFARAFAHAERAHILGQPWAIRHTAAHWLMLQIGRRRGDRREVWGQIIRIAAGGFLSLIGRLPNGNTGGANVEAERAMPLPPDLAALCGPPARDLPQS